MPSPTDNAFSIQCTILLRLHKHLPRLPAGETQQARDPSRLVRTQVPLQHAQKLLGHASIRRTQRYASLADSQWENVRSILG